jgi:hypothetical protein
LTGEAANAWRLALSPDGRWLASSGATTPAITLWDLTTGREKTRLAIGKYGGYGAVRTLAFSADSHRLAAVGSGQGRRVDDSDEVKVWDVATGKERSLGGDRRPEGSSIAFSPDGRTLAVGDRIGGLFLWELATGRLRHQFVGHQRWINSVAFSPDGRLLAASSPEAPVYVWDVCGTLRGPARKLTSAEAERCWTDLAATDAPAAFQSIRRLVSDPERTVPLLRDRLRPVSPADPKRLQELLAGLESKHFAERQRAEDELERLAERAESALRARLAAVPTLETRRRVEQLLDKLSGPVADAERLRALRAVEALEYLGTPEAGRILQVLGRGSPDALLTREAIAAQQRLSRRATAAAPPAESSSIRK